MRGDSKYFVIFVVINSYYCYIYLLRSNDKIMINLFIVGIKFKVKIKVLQSNRVGEYEYHFMIYVHNSELYTKS